MNKQLVAWGLLAFALAEPASAQESAPPAEDGGETTVTVTAEDCRRLVDHAPASDVAYTPGVDVHGNPVVGADLEDNSALIEAIPKTFELNLAFTPTGLPAALGTSDIAVGTVAYDINSGKLTYNGAPLGDAQAQAMAEACRKAGFR